MKKQFLAHIFFILVLSVGFAQSRKAQKYYKQAIEIFEGADLSEWKVDVASAEKNKVLQKLNKSNTLRNDEEQEHIGSKISQNKNGSKSTVAVNEHCAIMVIKDGTTVFYDNNSSGNGGTPYDASGNIVDLSKSDHAAVSYYDQGVGYTKGDATWCYKTMYYQKIQ